MYQTIVPSAAGPVGHPDGDAGDGAVDDGHEDGGGEHGDHGVRGEETGNQATLSVTPQIHLEIEQVSRPPMSSSD